MVDNYSLIKDENETFKVHNILVGININSNIDLEIEILLNYSKEYDKLFNEKLTKFLNYILKDKHTNNTLKEIYNQMDLIKWKEQNIRNNIDSYLVLKNKNIYYNEISTCNDVLYSLGRVAYFINEELKCQKTTV